jgi:hypothetical protein
MKKEMMMKKRILVACVALFALMAIPAQAQLKFGVKGGLNISKVHFDREVVSEGNVTGFNIGPMVEFKIPIIGLGFDAALLYSQKGFEVGRESMRTDYLDIPVNLKWKIGVPLARVYFTGGPYVSFRLAGDDFMSEIAGIKSGFETKSFGAGLNFGAGVELFSHLQVGFNYGLGLTNNYEMMVDEMKFGTGKDRGWSITAAVLF